MPHYVYFLRSPSGQLYIGQTKSISRRLKGHHTNKGAKFVGDYGVHELVYLEEYPTRLAASRRERQLKHWRRAKKEALIAGNLEQLKRL